MRKKTVFVYILCSLLLSTLAAALLVQSAHALVYGPNLLTNPGFEYGLAGWSTSAGTAVYSVDSSTFVSGHHSCKGVEISTESLGRLYQDVTSITSPGNQYRISGWIKTSNVVGTVVIGLDYVGSDGSTPYDGYVMEVGYGSEQPSLASASLTIQDWTFLQSEVFTLSTMPTDAQALWFLFDFNQGSGTAWWDDVSLVLVSNPVPVPTGTIVNVNLNPNVVLVFDDVTATGFATATATTSYPPPPPPAPSGPSFIGSATTTSSYLSPSSDSSFILPVWSITTTAKFSGMVTVGITYPVGTSPTQMLQTDIVPGDVNLDGVVNCKDLLLILKAMGSRPGDPKWNQNSDLNNNNKIDAGDLLIALKNYGRTSQWTDITAGFDYADNIIYGRTDHFSIFGIR